MPSHERVPGGSFTDMQGTEKMSQSEQEKLLDFPLIDPPPTAPKKTARGISGVGHTIKKGYLRIGKSMIKYGLTPISTLTSERIVDHIETNLVEPIVPEYAEGFAEAILEIAKDPENFIVFIGNHQGYGDSLGSAINAKYVTDLINQRRAPENQFRGFIIPIAASLVSGDQSASWQKLVGPLKKRALEYNLHAVDIVRKKDREQYDLHGSNKRYENELMKIINYEDDRIGDGLYVYLAGNMQEGRRKKRKFPGSLNPFGRPINGLAELNCKSFHGLVKSAELERHRKVIIIPVGSHGAPDIFDPEYHSLPTLKAVKEFVSSNPKSLLTVKVGLPVSYDHIVLEARREALEQTRSEEITSRNIDYKFGSMLAELLPPEAQGFYRKT